MSLATVYKTLDVFKKSELIQELNPSGNVYRYDANVSAHPHAVCLECGNVYDLHTHLFDDAINKMQTETDFNILSEKIYFYGICSQCNNHLDTH
jgi:Fur family peroxide stress response transcriptional regulator